MANRIKVLGAEAALPTTTGAATSFSSATVVRLVNSAASADYLVTVVETQGGTVVGSFTLPRLQTELLEKLPSHCVYSKFKVPDVVFSNEIQLQIIILVGVGVGDIVGVGVGVVGQVCKINS